MAIRRVQDDMSAVKEGALVCFDSNMIYGVCSRPVMVHSVRGTRVYYKRFNSEGEVDYEEGEDIPYKHIKTAKFVVDTLEEGLSMVNLGLECNKAVRVAEETVRREYTQKLQELIDSSKNDQTT